MPSLSLNIGLNNGRKLPFGGGAAPSGIPVASTSTVIVNSTTTLNKTNIFGLGPILSGTAYFDDTTYIGLIAPQTTYSAYGEVYSFGNQWIYILIEDYGEGAYSINTLSTNSSIDQNYIPTTGWSPSVTITAA
jgi:hypothetical protein